MSEPKTRPTGASVEDFIAAAPANRRDDAREIARMMAEITGEPAVMWGPSIVGFGTYALKYANGKTADWPIAAFSPRKASQVVYVARGFDGEEELLARLGPHELGRVCLYVKRLSDVDVDVLREIIARSTALARTEGR